ncbi:MAG: chromate transporter [Treponema sp.]|nr:chromate transporter [Treponema sp.]
MNLLLIFAQFCKIGVFAVGGGLATLPFLFEMAAWDAAWDASLSPEQIGNFLAIANAAPGALGVNTAAQTGFALGGVAGGFLAAAGLIFPAIIIITIIAKVFEAFRANRIVSAVFAGLRPAAAGLLCAAGLVTWKLSLYNPAFSVWYQALRWRECLLFAALFAGIRAFKLHPIVYIACAAAAGAALRL